MKITNDFLQQSNRLNDILNKKKLKTLTWIINYDNGVFIVNNMNYKTKISNITISKEKFFNIYGSEKSDGISDFLKIICYKYDEIEGFQNHILFETEFTIPNNKNVYLFYQHPFMINLNKIVAHVYE